MPDKNNASGLKVYPSIRWPFRLLVWQLFSCWLYFLTIFLTSVFLSPWLLSDPLLFREFNRHSLLEAIFFPFQVLCSNIPIVSFESRLRICCVIDSREDLKGLLLRLNSAALFEILKGHRIHWGYTHFAIWCIQSSTCVCYFLSHWIDDLWGCLDIWHCEAKCSHAELTFYFGRRCMFVCICWCYLRKVSVDCLAHDLLPRLPGSQESCSRTTARTGNKRPLNVEQCRENDWKDCMFGRISSVPAKSPLTSFVIFILEFFSFVNADILSYSASIHLIQIDKRDADM